MKNTQIIKKSFAAAAAIVLAVPTLGLVGSVLTDSLNSGSRSAQAYGNAPTVTNTATVGSPTADSNLLNNTATVVDKLCGQADLEVLSFSDGVTAINASTGTVYTASLKNNGPSPIKTFKITYSYDTTFLDDITVASSGGSVGSDTSSTTGNIKTESKIITPTGLLTNGESISITLSSTVLANAVDGDDYTVTFEALSTGLSYDNCAFQELITANNTANDNTEMTSVADLAITKISSGGGSSITNATGTIFAGSTVMYTLGIANNGPSTAAANITVVDTIPSQITPIIASGANYTSSADWNCTFTAPTMTCINTNPMTNGASSSIEINANITSTMVEN